MPRKPAQFSFLRELRTSKGFTQKQLALEAGCSEATIQSLELGRMSPSPKLIARIVECFNQDDLILRMRATNMRLNRRAQRAESVARDNVEACERKGVSLGRALLGWAYEDLKRRMREVVDPPEQRETGEASKE